MLVCAVACVDLAFRDPSCDNRVIGEPPDLTQNGAILFFPSASHPRVTTNDYIPMGLLKTDEIGSSRLKC